MIDPRASQHCLGAGEGEGIGPAPRGHHRPICEAAICPRPSFSWVLSHRLCLHRAHGGWVASAEAKEGAFRPEFCSRSDITGLMIMDLS